MISINTDLLGRLKKADASAWYEMWEVFGPAIERLIGSIASRYFGQETIKDVSQETLARVYQEIAKFAPNRGVKFSTWLYAIAKHELGRNPMDGSLFLFAHRRRARKRS